MCNAELGGMHALSASCSTSGGASSSSKLFRPWDAALPGSKHKKRSRAPRKEQQPEKNVAETSTTSRPSPTAHAVSAVAGARLLSEREKTSVLPGVVSEGTHQGLAAMADALYAEMSRAQLASLGLVGAAELARLRARKQRPKKYRCPHCQVAFSNNGQLRGHIRIHTGERPFACPHSGCGKAFTRNEELTRHRRIHSGVRPYPCSVCGKRFGRKDHLKKHARTHQKVPHPPATTVAAAAAAAAAFNNMAGFFPLEPALLPSFVPYPYPGVYGF